MGKFLLTLVVSLSLAMSAGAAPYKVVDGNGNAFGPVIGVGEMIVKAPDGTPLGVHVGPFGFQNDVPPGAASPFYYLINTATNSPCQTRPYMLADTVPARGWVIISSGAAYGSPAEIWYASNLYEVVGSSRVYQGTALGCVQVQLPSTTLLGAAVGFEYNGATFPTPNHPPPFTAVPWTAPDTDPPIQ